VFSAKKLIEKRFMNRKRKASNLRPENKSEENSFRLPDDCKMVFSLSEMLGFSISEISELLNISESEAEIKFEKAGFSLTELFEFNLNYCDGMVERVMKEIEKL
jgi:RNA polymerase sigma-70 factor (ECF subfamily)